MSHEEGADAGTGFFAANEKILVFHGPLLYEGKILSVPKARHENGEPVYVIHYSGWNKKWDERVPESRVLKYNEDNLKRQKEHKIAYEASFRGAVGKKSEQKSSGGGGGKPSASAGGSSKNTTSIAGDSVSNDSVGEAAGGIPLAGEDPSKGPKVKGQAPFTNVPLLPEINAKKKKLLEHVESELKYMNKQVVEFGLPDKLKLVLVDDFDVINRQKKLMNLPGRHTVDTLLKGYLEALEATPGTHKSHFAFVEGIKDLFNTMLGGQLLYRFERQQYAGFIKKLEDKDPNITEKRVIESMSGFYGPTHLLRLFTKLGSSLAFTEMDQALIALFKKYAQDLCEYIVSKRDEFFQTTIDYGMSQPDYQRKELV